MKYLYKIYFYRDANGNEPVIDYLKELSLKTDKSSRLNLRKIQDYINILQQCGKSAGEPYMKHLDGDIWELRPLRNRIFFVAWDGNKFILLHHFIKKTQKTPKREIEQAKKEGIRPCIYTHPLGFHGHAAGPTIGLWDHQEGVEGSGDYPLHDNTAYSLELNATVYSKTYGCDIRMAMESDILLKDGKVYFLSGRQENFHVVK